MIQIITIDEQNRVVERHISHQLRSHLRGKWLTAETIVGDQIHIRPDWPPIGDPAFAEKPRAWHAAHNPQIRGDE